MPWVRHASQLHPHDIHLEHEERDVVELRRRGKEEGSKGGRGRVSPFGPLTACVSRAAHYHKPAAKRIAIRWMPITLLK